MSQQILQVSGLSVELGNKQVLKNISFSAKKGETIAVIGPNGAGKTVLFRALIGLVPYTGTITWHSGTKIGYVPQRLYINRDFPLTTREFFCIKDRTCHEFERVMSAVGFKTDTAENRLNTAVFLKQKLASLSGGELQKVLIAWALIGSPDILLFDEPTSGIDVSSEETIYSLLHRLQEREKMTVILISHELQIVYRYATNVICLNRESVCVGPPNKAMNDENLHKLFGSEIGLYHHHL
jgi:zinc transport system ATP-binding protein